MIVKSVGYWLDRFDLLMSRDETFYGASYTDIKAVLPAKIILMVIAALVAVSFFSVIVLKDLRIPAMTTVLMLLSSMVIGYAWPAMMERFSVQPNRAEKESEYISRNIESTRYAYGLTEDKVTYQENWGGQGGNKRSSGIRCGDRVEYSPARSGDYPPHVYAAPTVEKLLWVPRILGDGSL